MDDILGSNLQICFVNEHHQASESSDNDGVSDRERFNPINSSFVIDFGEFENEIKNFNGW